jgi:hypothetical protein
MVTRDMTSSLQLPGSLSNDRTESMGKRDAMRVFEGGTEYPAADRRIPGTDMRTLVVLPASRLSTMVAPTACR